ncbi:MAG UNVERIFIED_CONTAM: hypothetical protein LVR29_14545 [Microcystis novacekii LVE1205-3]
MTKKMRGRSAELPSLPPVFPAIPSRPTGSKVVINTPAPSPAPTPAPPKPAGSADPDFLQRRRPFDR